MKTLKWIAIVALFIGTSLSVNAQQGQKKHRHKSDSAQMEKRMEKMTQELELTEKQQKEFEALFAEHKTEAKALREKHKPEREKQRAEMDAVKAEFEKDLAQILTPEQKVEFDALKKQRMEKRKTQKDCDCCCKGKGNGHGKGQGQNNE